MDWEELAKTLSPDTLAALREHSERRANDEINGVDENCVSDEALSSNSVFREQSYWDSRFEKEPEYDWLLTYPQVKNSIIPYIKDKRCSILIVGCGNSSFSTDLYDDGYENITNIDFSEVVIEKMKDRNSSRPNMTWLCMDMTDMSAFDSESFDVVIDKAAMDALVVTEGDVWDPLDDVIASVDRMCTHVSRVLKASGGLFLQISFAQPHFRTKYLMGLHATHSAVNAYKTYEGYCERYNWNLSVRPLQLEAGTLDSFLFVMNR